MLVIKLRYKERTARIREERNITDTPMPIKNKKWIYASYIIRRIDCRGTQHYQRGNTSKSRRRIKWRDEFIVFSVSS